MNKSESIIPSLNFQLKLMKSSFKVPLELIKRNHKTISKTVEKQNQTLLLNINRLIESNIPNKADSFLKIVKNYEAFLENLKSLVAKHNEYVGRLQMRMTKVMEFELIIAKNGTNSSPDDLLRELTPWYREQIDLTISNYLIRTGHIDVGYELLTQKGLEKLVDRDVIEEGLEIYKEIKEKKNLDVLIKWCDLNKKNLSKLNNSNGENLEFETYFQKFIELLKEGRIYDSIELSKKFLINRIGEEEEIDFSLSKPKLSDLMNLPKTAAPTGATEAGTSSSSLTLSSERDPPAQFLPNSDEEMLAKLTDAARLLIYDSLDMQKLFSFSESRESRENHHKSVYSKFLLILNSKKEPSALDYYDPELNEDGNFKDNFFARCLSLYSPQKWDKLADFFIYNYNQLYGINQNLDFLVLLSTGIAALKTKTCNEDLFHKPKVSPDEISFDEFLQKEDDQQLLVKTLNTCPICSLELKYLSRSLPYSHQVVSNIFNNPVMLPNGHIYQLNQLLKLNESLKVMSASGTVLPLGIHLGDRKTKKRKSRNLVQLVSTRRNKRLYKQIYNDSDGQGHSVRSRNTMNSIRNRSEEDTDENSDEDSEEDSEEEEEEDEEEEEEEEEEGEELVEDEIVEEEEIDVGEYGSHEASMHDVSSISPESSSSESQSELNWESDLESDSNGLQNYFERENFNEDLIFEDLKYLGSFSFKDPLSNEVFLSSEISKVFPT